MSEGLHGGRVWEAARRLGLPPQDLLDFSANLNPCGMPKSVRAVLQDPPPGLLSAYPDEEASRLRTLLCARHGARPEALVLGAGSAALLFLALRALAPRRVLVPVPCFREQPRAVAACGAELVPVPMEGLRLDLDALEPERRGCDAVLLTNPHNPTGQLLPREALLDWARRHACGLVLDEAFMDYLPGESALPGLRERPRTVVLRSLTKFFAMPALRVGHAFADPATAARMRGLQESWPVGSLELLAAETALGDRAYAARTLAWFREEPPALRGALESLGLKVHPGRAPFLLVELEQARGTALAAALAARGILLRTCADWPGLGDRYLRIAVRTPSEDARLVEALRP